MHMVPRAQRRVVPESAFAGAITMAVEQGRLHELLIDKRDGSFEHWHPDRVVTVDIHGEAIKGKPIREHDLGELIPRLNEIFHAANQA